MSTYSYTAKATVQDTEQIVSGVCYGLTKGDAEVDALKDLTHRYPDVPYTVHKLVDVQE